MYFRYVPIAARSGLAVEREGWRKTSAGAFQHQTPLHNDIPTVGQSAHRKRIVKLSKEFFSSSFYSLLLVLMPLSTMLHTQASTWSQRAYCSVSRHISQTTWDHGVPLAGKERKKRMLHPGLSFNRPVPRTSSR